MPKDRNPQFAQDGYTPIHNGFQPRVSQGAGEQAGHIPTSAQAKPGPGTPPNQGSGGKK